MELGLLAPHYVNWPLPHLDNPLRRRDLLQQTHPRRSAARPKISLATTCRNRAVEKQKAEEYSLAGVCETMEGSSEANCTTEHDLLLLYICVGCRD
jgi:hypothetical protein